MILPVDGQKQQEANRVWLSDSFSLPSNRTTKEMNHKRKHLLLSMVFRGLGDSHKEALGTSGRQPRLPNHVLRCSRKGRNTTHVERTTRRLLGPEGTGAPEAKRPTGRFDPSIGRRVWGDVRQLDTKKRPTPGQKVGKMPHGTHNAMVLDEEFVLQEIDVCI